MRNFFLLGFVICVVTAGFCAAGDVPNDALQVSNRSATADEFGYRPEDGSTVQVTPPGFVWLPEAEADSYVLQCSQREDFSSIGYEISKIPGNVHCPPSTLSPGQWYWRYTFETKDGKRAGWSRIRAFTIASDAKPFPQPTIGDFMGRIPKEHPKLILRPETVAAFRQNIEKNIPLVKSRFIARAEKMLNDPIQVEEPAPYPDGHRGVGQENIELWRKNQKIVQDAVDRAANLAFAFLLTGDSRLGAKTREIVMAVVSWPADGTTSYRYNDECAMPILCGISRAYTWAYHAFTEKDREKILQTMTARGREVYQILYDEEQQTVRPYESHRNRAWHFLGEAAIAFSHEIPEARHWLQYALDIFYNVYPVWSDDDGGWHEGAAYWKSYMERITWWLDVFQAAFKLDGYTKPFFNKAGDFPLYVVSPGSEFGGFGDNSDTLKPASLGSLMDLLASRAENPYWKWYAVKVGIADPNREPTYYDLAQFRVSDAAIKAPDDLPESKVFHGTGIASLHSNLVDSNEDVHVLFKSSPFGRRSHGFNAQNSFLLWAFGRPLLTWSGHRDWHGSPHHTQWMWETASDNSITVNGEGQIKHSPLAKGDIIDEYLDPRFDYVAGDATEAYGGHLKRFVRSICFIKPRLIFVLDELEAPEPSTFTLNLHSYNPFNIKAQYEIETGDDVATARIAFVTPSDLVVTQSEGCTPPPVGFDKKQWNLKAETPGNVLQTHFLTMIRPYPSHKVLESKMEFARKGNVQMYFCAIDNHKVILFVNPNREPFTFGVLSSDAAFLLTGSYNDENAESILFAADAGFVKMSGKALFESPMRNHYFTQWKDYENSAEKK